MSFTLAHPAAVLPFRRWCPKYFDFAALIVGSIAPDLATSIDDWEYFSHSIAGSLGFCLPAGLLTLAALRHLCFPLVSTLPEPHRQALLPLCARPGTRSPLVIVASLLTGTWLHIIWDLFTHDHSWLVHRAGIFSVRLAGLPLNHLLWLLGTLGGGAILIVKYLSLLKKTDRPIKTAPGSQAKAYLIWACICVVPLIPAAFRTSGELGRAYTLAMGIRPFSMYYLGCLYAALVVAGLLLRFFGQGRTQINPA
jgi:hypothetical protein